MSAEDSHSRLIENLRFRKERTARQIAFFNKSEARYPWLRLAAFLAGLLVTFIAFQFEPQIIGWLVAILSLALFVIVALLHNRLIGRIAQLTVFDQFLASQIARCELDWENIPNPSPFTVLPEHPFNLDLGITGEKSIHQLLDICISLGGSNKLADLLLKTSPEPIETVQRQLLVKELTLLPGFRTRLILHGKSFSSNSAHHWDTSPIVDWLKRHQKTLSLRPLLIVLFLLAIVNIVLFFLHAFGIIPPVWAGTLAVYLGLQSLRFRETSEIFEESYTLGRQLGQLRDILIELETYPFSNNSLLNQRVIPFRSEGTRPSIILRRLTWIISAASIRSNPFLGLFLNLIVPWDMFFAYQLERFKDSLRGSLPAWLEAWYEMEMLSSIANFAELNPCYTFPVISPVETQPVLKVTAIGHPLIQINTRVTNDFQINQLGEIYLVSGSNMSGKSTFLRTLGVNLVLALAGSPVACQEMKTIPFRVFTSMTINDSLSEGVSFFYAEVRRLKALLDQLELDHPYPTFFLIDEIFRGTNNRERELGSRAYTRSLTGRFGTGLISTHDLTLVKFANETETTHNYHFKEDIVGEKMVFDYIIRHGASPTTNALKIMALAGLPIPTQDITG